MLHDNYLCLVESNKQQIEEVTSKIQTENSETRATLKRVWIRPMHSASVAFSLLDIKSKKKIQIMRSHHFLFLNYITMRILFFSDR